MSAVWPPFQRESTRKLMKLLQRKFIGPDEEAASRPRRPMAPPPSLLMDNGYLPSVSLFVRAWTNPAASLWSEGRAGAPDAAPPTPTAAELGGPSPTPPSADGVATFFGIGCCFKRCRTIRDRGAVVEETSNTHHVPPPILRRRTTGQRPIWIRRPCRITVTEVPNLDLNASDRDHLSCPLH
jgi:hypothetical protein